MLPGGRGGPGARCGGAGCRGVVPKPKKSRIDGVPD
jgi:hypothetical protein